MMQADPSLVSPLAALFRRVGEVVPGPWNLAQSDLRRRTTDHILNKGILKPGDTTGADLGRAFGVGSEGAQVIPLPGVQ